MNPYEDRQRVRDREYAEAWSNLGAKERSQLAKAGVSGPQMPVYATGKHAQDALLESCVSPVENSEEETVNTKGIDAGALVRRLIGELIASDNTRLTIECLSLVTNISYDGASMTDIARKCGVTRATVSKRCVEICNALNMPPSRAMRQLTARTSYEQRARHCHNRSEH